MMKTTAIFLPRVTVPTTYLLSGTVLLAAEAVRHPFDIPGGDAAETLRQFADQSGKQVIYLVDAVKGVATNPVKGELAAREVLDDMLRNTALDAIEDPTTGAMMVKRKAQEVGPPAKRESPAAPADQPATILNTNPAVPTKPMRTSFLARMAAVLGAFTAADLSAQTTVPANSETVELSPFQVNAATDNGYVASSALTGTRTNEKLANLPNSISVITSDFMKDFAITDFFGAVNYGVDVENITNGTDVTGAPVGASASNQVLIRGIASLRQLRDGFIWFLPMDSFNIERIEFNRGPSGQVYGDVDPVGTLNVSTKRPLARLFGEASARYDNFGTRRFTLDLNVPANDRLQVRINAVNSDIEKSRQRADTIQRAYAGSVRWLPFKDKNTTVDLNFEAGHYRLNLAAEQLNDGTTAYVRGSGTNALDANPNAAGVQTNGVGMRQIAPATGNAHVYLDIGGTLYDMKSTATAVFRNSAVLTTAAVASGADPQNPKLLPLQTVADSLIPYGEDWGGPDNHSDSRYSIVNLELTHRVGRNLNVLLSGNTQWADSSQESTFSGSSVLGANSRQVFIDVNPSLPNQNVPGATIPNPRYEQYFVGYVPVFITSGSRVSGLRASAVYDLPIAYQESSLRFVAATNYREEKLYNNRFGYSLTLAEMARRGLAGAAATYTANTVNPVHYLSDGNSDEALKLRTVSGVETWFRTSPASNTRYDESLGAVSVNTLGSFFKQRVHVSAGIDREYFRENISAPAVTDALGEVHFADAQGNAIANTGNFDVPLARFVRAYTTNLSYGAVVRVLPWMSVSAGSFESSLFSESNSADLAGKPALPHIGSGQDYSLRFNLLDDRIFATVEYFDNVAKNNVLALSAAAEAELNALLPANQKLVGTGDYRDQKTNGWEFELQANVTPAWTLRAAYGANWTTYTRFYPLTQAYLAEARAAASAKGLAPDAATSVTQTLIAATEGANGNLRRETANVATRYSFTRDRLRGLSVGASARYVLGHPVAPIVVGPATVYPASKTVNYVLVNPFLSWRHKFWRHTVTVQENINNLFDRRSQQWLVQHNFSIFTEPRQFITTVTISL